MLVRDFPYAKFIDAALMTSTYLDQFRGDDDSLEKMFQWASRILLKSMAIFKYSMPLISSGIRAIWEVIDLEDKITFLQNEKLALEKAKQEMSSKLAKLKEQVRLKDQQLEESRA